jgi:hypothetical protein
MTVLAFVSTQARDRAKARVVAAPVARGRHAAPFVLSSPGPLAAPAQLRVYHPSLTARQRHQHLSSVMARSACAVWSGLLSTSLTGAALVTASTASESATALAAAALAACTGGLAVWLRAGRGAREVAAQLQAAHPGEPVVTRARADRLGAALTQALAVHRPLLDREGAEGAQARQTVWEAARAPKAARASRRS